VNWVAAPGGGGGITALTLDVTAAGAGSQPATVIGIQARPVNPIAPIAGQALVWDGLAWTPTLVAVATPPSLLSGLWLHGALAAATPFTGIITAIVGPSATVAYYGEIPMAGLISGEKYFLSAAGTMVTPAPAQVVGQISLYIGYAKSTTVFVLAPGGPVQL
jgi:hypothetical protein